MAKLTTKSTINAQITITLNEQEARALEAITGYGINAFLEVFYRDLGYHYLEPYEDGARELFKSVREILPREFKKIDQARSGFNE